MTTRIVIESSPSEDFDGAVDPCRCCCCEDVVDRNPPLACDGMERDSRYGCVVNELRTFLLATKGLGEV